MSYVIGYEDKKQGTTFFLSKVPTSDSPKNLSWAMQLSQSHPFDSLEDANNVLEESLVDFEGVYVINVPMSRDA